MTEAPRGTLLAIFNQLPTGAHHGRHEAMRHLQCSACTLDVGGPGVINVDGEILKHDGTIALRCLPKAYALFAPPSYEAPSVKRAEKLRNSK